jgi:hypothetical protein
MIWNPTLIDYPPTPPVPKYHLRKDILPIEIDLSDDEGDRVVEDDSSDLSDLPVKMENGKEEVSAIRSPEENPVIETGQLPRLCPWTIQTQCRGDEQGGPHCDYDTERSPQPWWRRMDGVDGGARISDGTPVTKLRHSKVNKMIEFHETVAK